MLEDSLDADGDSFCLAARSAAALRSRTPELADVVTWHIRALTGVESGTRARYERMAATHILPGLGARPVDQITRADIALWFNNVETEPKTRKNIHATRCIRHRSLHRSHCRRIAVSTTHHAWTPCGRDRAGRPRRPGRQIPEEPVTG